MNQDETATADAIVRLLHRADDAAKAAPGTAPEGTRERVTRLLDDARSRLPGVTDQTVRLELAGQLARRFADLDRETLGEVLGPSPGVRRAPTRVRSGPGDDGVEPGRVPPGQHLTAGWPVLHVGAPPSDVDPASWTVVVSGRVAERVVVTADQLGERLPVVRATTDLHCVTGWSRLDNAWEGVRVADLLSLARPRPEATHLVASGHPAYSANLDLGVACADDTLVAWAHDDLPLDRAHGGPLRLVVPARYGWKSVKWLTELRLVDRDVRGYWEERGYHDIADPWTEQRFRA